MKGLFIPEITAEMFRNGCLESIEALMAEGEVYDIEYDPKSAESEIIRCKDCRHRIINDHYGERGYLKIKGYCELDTGDPFELGRHAENDDWFCADAERRTDEDDYRKE